MPFLDEPICGGELVETTEDSHWIIKWYKERRGINTSYGCALSCENTIQAFQSGQKLVDGPIVILSSLGIAASLFTIVGLS